MKKSTTFPKVKWIYDDLSKYNEKGDLYVKVRSTLLWQFYFRFVKSGCGWFTPCDACQRSIENFWRASVRRFDFTPAIVKYVLVDKLCNKCKDIIRGKLYNVSLSFDSTKMEIELSRSWVRSDKDEDCIEVSFSQWEEKLDLDV